MATLVKEFGETSPEIMTIKYIDNEGLKPIYAAINLNVVSNSNMYTWDSLVLPDFALENIHNADKEIKRSVLIAHIIKAYYNDNEMTAILSNYLSDMENENYKLEFNELQKLRKLAKETATHIVSNNIF